MRAGIGLKSGTKRNLDAIKMAWGFRSHDELISAMLELWLEYRPQPERLAQTRTILELFTGAPDDSENL